MKFGIRTPSLKKRIAARTSWKRYVRHNLGFKAPRGWGWLTNPKRAAYNRVYNRTTVSVDRLLSGRGRRRHGSRHDGAAFVLVVGVVVAAAFGVYLLIAGAVVFVAWLVRVATRKPAGSPASSDATIPPAPPSAEYQALVPVEPAVFEDPVRMRGTAQAVLAAWLRQVPKAPRRVADLVRSVSTRTRLIGRLTTELEGRRFVWRTAPFRGRQSIGAPPLSPEVLDPWNPPADLRMASRYVTACWTCGGDGRIACASCSGAGRVTCTSCGGGGKYYGTAANGAQRLLNCKGCKGKGTVTCGACSRGVVDCVTCSRAKKLECWLEIDESSRQDVQVEPDGEVTKAFVWGQDGVSATREQIALDARVVDVVTADQPLGERELPSSVPAEWRHDFWARIRAQIQPGERVRQQAFMLLEVPTTEVTYAVLGEQQTVAFEGRLMLAPPPWSDVLFARRATILRRSKLVLAALPISGLAIYLARGTYFVSDRVAPLLAGIAGAATAVAICAYAVLWYATLGRRSAVKWALGSIAPLAVATGLVVMAEPSLSRARSYIAHGELQLARTELYALGPATDPELAPVWADIALQDVLVAPSCSVALDSAKQIPEGMPQHATALAHADMLALSAAHVSFQAGELEQARRALDCASTRTRESTEALGLRGQIALTGGRECAESRQWDCAFSKLSEAEQLGLADARELARQARQTIESDVKAAIAAAKTERDVERRLPLETAALGLWTTYLAGSHSSRPPEIAQLEQSATRDEKVVERLRELERKQAEKAEQRRRAAEAREEKRRLAAEERERRREAAAERRHMYSSLVCNDGSLSPSCVCGGSWRGCCSHHGGVSGCQGN